MQKNSSSGKTIVLEDQHSIALEDSIKSIELLTIQIPH